MELFTLDRSFQRQDVIDGFLSAIWTERYYGDSAVELVVPATTNMIEKLSPGVFLGLVGSDEVMILESAIIEKGQLKVSGISLLAWLNNRFIRASAPHEDRYWTLTGKPGWMVWAVVYYMCCEGSSYLNGTWPMGIPDPQHLVIPELGLDAYDDTGNDVTIGIPYGPVYDAIREIATTFEIGIQIRLGFFYDPNTGINQHKLGFRSYRGLDHTSRQNTNPIVRFSPEMDSLAEIKELQSIAALKTEAYAFAPGNPEGLATTAGHSKLTEMAYSGFDLRVQLVMADDVTTDMVNGDPAKLLEILDNRAKAALGINRFIKTVDGEIVPTGQFRYGIHYSLGDLIEVQGNSEIISISRVTEYIRSQDGSGEKAYPTVAMLV